MNYEAEAKKAMRDACAAMSRVEQTAADGMRAAENRFASAFRSGPATLQLQELQTWEDAVTRVTAAIKELQAAHDLVAQLHELRAGAEHA